MSGKEGEEGAGATSTSALEEDASARRDETDPSVQFDLSAGDVGTSEKNARKADELFDSSSSSGHAHLTESGFSSSSSSHPTYLHSLHRQSRPDFLLSQRFQHQQAAGTYDELLSQFGALSQDLAKVVAKCSKMHHDNESIVESYNRLKEQHLRLLERYKDARRLANEEAETRRAAERRRDEIVQNLSKQLEVKAEEFAQLQVQLQAPRDSNVLRSKIQQELEGAHRAQMYSKDKEIEKVREILSKERSAHELLKTEFEQYTLNQKAEMEAMKAERMAAASEFRFQIDTLRNELEENSKKETIRLRSLGIESVREERDALGEQVTQLRAKLEETKLKLDQVTAKSQREAVEFETMIREVRSNESALRQLQENHSAEVRRLEDALDKVNAGKLGQQGEISKLETQLLGANKALDDERARASRQSQDINLKHEKERHELRAHIDSLEAQLTRAKARHEEQIKLMEAQHNSSLDELTRRQERLNSSLEEEKRKRHSLEQEKEELNMEVRDATRDFNERNARLSEQRDTQANEARRAMKEKDVLHEKLKNVASNLDHHRQRAEDVEKEYRALQEQHRAGLDQMKSQAEKLQRLESELNILKETLQGESEEKENLRITLHDITNVQTEAKEREDDIKIKFAETLFTQSQRGKKTIEQLEKKHRSYKSALLKCKGRIQELKQKFATSQRELKTQLMAHDRLRQRNQELERYRDMYFQLSATSAAAPGDDEGYDDDDDNVIES